MQEIAWNYRVGKTTVHFILAETCDVLWEMLVEKVMPEPTTGQWEEIANNFRNKWNMPNCIGALDGKHVSIQAPQHSGSLFFNYKKSFSIVLLAVCDAYYRFVLVDVGACGSSHDSTIFQESEFGKAVLNKTLAIPPPKKLPGSDVSMQCFFVADAAFPLHQNIMRPYPGSHLSTTKRIFNYRLSTARRTIENTFGILAARWRILRGPINASVDMCEKFVRAVLVLHNFLQQAEINLRPNERKYSPVGFGDIMLEDGTSQLGTWRSIQTAEFQQIKPTSSHNAKRSLLEAQDQLADYFMSDEGQVH